MDKGDYINLIMVHEDLDRMDDILKELTGHVHGEGKLKNLDLLYTLLVKYSKLYDNQNDDVDDVFFDILYDREKTAEEKADKLFNDITI